MTSQPRGEKKVPRPSDSKVHQMFFRMLNTRGILCDENCYRLHYLGIIHTQALKKHEGSFIQDLLRMRIG